MDIVKHIFSIQERAADVIEHVEGKNYRAAHGALDDIAPLVRLAHDHVDKLQQVTPKDPAPAGGG